MLKKWPKRVPKSRGDQDNLVSLPVSGTFFSISTDIINVQLGKTCAALSVFTIVVALAGCVCLGPLNYPKHWYNASFDPAPDNTINIRVMALGDSPIKIVEEHSDQISIAICYYIPAKFDHHLSGDNLEIVASAMYDNDWTQGVGADVYIYLPKNGNYTLNIYNMAADNSSVYRKNSQITVEYAGNVTVWVNDYEHLPPF
ncbi:hypothetical protein [Methanocella sp. MCL-LM]|uniref:hypothetical protein n=1 Tax=Methanocella sp. MCL-LM TaxID=3412035 RepID=UPI003C755F56